MRVFLMAALLLASACSAQHRQADPYREVSLAGVTDDLSAESLRAAADTSVAYYRGLGGPRRNGGDHATFALGTRRYDTDDLLRSARRVIEIMEGTPAAQVPARLAAECRAFAAASPAKFTAYYEPRLLARRHPDRRFRYPLYAAPDAEQRASLVAKFGGRLPTRAEIDGGRALDGLGLELAWLDDPVARFFLQIQGSGLLVFADATSMRVGFAASNDARYRSVGSVMLARGLLRKDEASSSAMQTWLAAHPDKRDALLAENPRYIFFREMAEPEPEALPRSAGPDAQSAGSGPIGALGLPLVAGRSLATDPAFVPRGILLFVRTQVPVLGDDAVMRGRRSLQRFAFSHDAGAAIRGPSRADIFWGSGDRAGMEAGAVNEGGELYLLVCGDR